MTQSPFFSDAKLGVDWRNTVMEAIYLQNFYSLPLTYERSLTRFGIPEYLLTLAPADGSQLNHVCSFLCALLIPLAYSTAVLVDSP